MQRQMPANKLVHVWDITSGARMVAYAIEGEAGSGTMQISGAAVDSHPEVLIAPAGSGEPVA